ncbi:MAG: sulfatase activating formylglycine-generating enzyme [Verrucomicrobiales bacterium]|jgi:formylglycine-generating enzyme required for sulfatase activity
MKFKIAIVSLLVICAGILVSTWRGMPELGSGAIGESVSIDLPNGETLVMKYCPGGKFTMGSPAGEENRLDNEDQVEVELSSHYWMAETECTQAQWVALMGTNPSKFKGERLPVETVSWDDAQAYVSKLNETVKPPAGWKWSLPSEAQWERACRAGTTTAFCFGDDDKELTDYVWFSNNSEQHIHPVRTKKPNPWGLHDMHGNVFEWCEDYYVVKLPGGRDPLLGEGSGRVCRGGSWYFNADYARSAFRGFSGPGYAGYGNGFGFRAVLAPG